MDTKVNYTVVGLFVIILGAALVGAIFWLSAERSTKTYNIYSVFMHESVSGLSLQSPVKLNGVNVGFVKKMSLSIKHPQQVHLLLEIEQGTPITQSTVATLMAQGVTGLTYIGLENKTPDAPTLKPSNKPPYPIIKSEPSLLVQLDDALREVTSNFRTLSTSVGKVFNQKNREEMAEILANTAEFTQTLANNSSKLDNAIQSAQQLLKNASKASNEFPDAMSQLQATLASIKQAVNSVKQTMNTAQTTIQNVNNQTVPSAEETIEKMNNVLTQLQQVSKQLKRNPAELVRGRLPPPPGPGE